MPILLAVDGGIARVTIDRPEVLNAIDATAERELEEVWTTIERNRDIRAVVLTGAGERAFSTGADMSGGSGPGGLEYWAMPRPGGFGGIALRQTLDVPVIARVNGHAVVGGFEMVLGCDIVIAVDCRSPASSRPSTTPSFLAASSTPRSAAGSTTSSP